MIRIGKYDVFRISVCVRSISVAVVSGLFFCGILQACKEAGEKYLKDDIRYFQEHVEADMDYDDIVDQFGIPPIDLNEATAESNGLHIYQYPLMDTTYCRIGYLDKIIYVCQVDSNQNILSDVISIAKAED